MSTSQLVSARLTAATLTRVGCLQLQALHLGILLLSCNRPLSCPFFSQFLCLSVFTPLFNAARRCVCELNRVWDVGWSGIFRNHKTTNQIRTDSPKATGDKDQSWDSSRSDSRYGHSDCDSGRVLALKWSMPGTNVRTAPPKLKTLPPSSNGTRNNLPSSVREWTAGFSELKRNSG